MRVYSEDCLTDHSRKIKIIAVIASIITITTVVGIIIYVVKSSHNNVVNNNDTEILVAGRGGVYFIKSSNPYGYMTIDSDNYIELANIFNPKCQSWLLTEVKKGIYLIQDICTGLYMTGVYTVEKRSTSPIPHTVIELKTRGPDMFQLWKLSCNTKSLGSFSCDKFDIRLHENNMPIGVYGHHEDIMFGNQFSNWSLVYFDNNITSYILNDDTTVDKYPTGTAAYYSNTYKYISNRFFNKSLSASFDVGDVWNVVRFANPWNYDFIINVNGTSLVLTDVDNVVQLTNVTDKLSNDQLWLIRLATVGFGIQNVKTGLYIYPSDQYASGWITCPLTQGWHSWNISDMISDFQKNY